MKEKRVIVGVDPGFVSLGLAFFDAKARERKTVPKPFHTATFSLKASLKGDTEHSALKIGDIFRRALEGHRVEIIYCERMEFQPGARGHSAVNDILGVAFACGIFAAIAKDIIASYHAAPVSRWKGQLSKAQVVRRIVKKWDGEIPDTLSAKEHPSHDWDAVGIGLWGMGFF